MSTYPAKSALLDYILMTAKRPGLYYGSSRVDDVRRHLDGWRAHRRVCEDKDSFADYFFENFHGFVEQHYGDRRTLGWNGLIREHTSTDDEGFQKFESLLKHFASEYVASTG